MIHSPTDSPSKIPRIDYSNMDSKLITRAPDQKYYQQAKHNKDSHFRCHFYAYRYCFVVVKKTLVVPMKSIN
jgi:hypothetical protein